MATHTLEARDPSVRDPDNGAFRDAEWAKLQWWGMAQKGALALFTPEGSTRRILVTSASGTSRAWTSSFGRRPPASFST